MIWTVGRSEIERLLAKGELASVTGETTSGVEWTATAETRLAPARVIRDADPESSFILAYESVHIVGMGLLAQQGLRPTPAGGHLAVEAALRAQFGNSFKAYRWMRRERHQRMYPAFPGDHISAETLTEALGDADAMIVAAGQLIPELSLFR